MTTPAAGELAVSTVVATENDAAAYVVAAGLVISLMVSVPVVLAAKASVEDRVMVTTLAATTTSPLGTRGRGVPVNPPVKSTVGLAPITNAGLNVTTISLPGFRAPSALVVNRMVQVVAVAPAAIEDPEKLTPVSPVMTTGDAGEAAVSGVVATENDAAEYVAEVGLVMSLMVSVPVVLAAKASVEDRVMVTTLAATPTLALGTRGRGVPVNPPVKSTVGLAPITNA